MNIKQSVLTAALAAGLALGSGPAAAYIYADSGLTINGLTINITGTGTVTVTRFDFNQTDTATLNGAALVTTATCGGTPGAGNNNCTSALGSMDAPAVNAPGSAPVIRTNNATTAGNFTSYGQPPGAITTGNWSNADSVITTAELVNLGSPTATNQIAESLINTASSAAATSQIQSITGFSITFTVTGATDVLDLSFMADPDLLAAIQGQTTGTYSAQGNINTSFTLAQNVGGSGFITWAPRGTAANDCIAAGGTTCTETADTQNLNTNVGTTANNTTDPFSNDPNLLTQTAFGIHVTGLTAGTWTLTLNSQTSTQLAFTPIPEPGVLALLGIGLLGLFATGRRKTLS